MMKTALKIDAVVPPKLIEKAMTLIVAIELEDQTAKSEATNKLLAWRSTKPEHELAYHEAFRQWQLISNVSPDLKRNFSAAETTSRNPLLSTHATLSLAGLLLVAALAKAGSWYWFEPIFEQSITSKTAEIKHIDLPDGSALDVNAQSDLKVTLYRSRREVELVTGDVRFNVKHDNNVPFNVHTQEGEVKVVGTIFHVTDRGNGVRVSVEKGHVKVIPLNQNTQKLNEQLAVDLLANDQVTIKNGALGKVESVDVAKIASWPSGWLVFEDVSLKDALLEINPYRHSTLKIADYASNNLRLTARFLAKDSEQLDQTLPRVLPILLETQSDGTTLIVRRNK